MKWIEYQFISSSENDQSNVNDEGNRITFFYPCHSFTICSPYEVELKRGHYIFELWGSQGGDARELNTENVIKGTGGRGAYVSGTIRLNEPKKLYLYIGSKGEDQESTKLKAYGRGGFNGGGDGGADLNNDAGSSYSPPESGAGGGGSSDIRLIKEEGNKIESLKSRIIVAGAGGGATSVVYDSDDNCQYDPSKSIESDILCSMTSRPITLSPHGGPAGALSGFRTNTITYPGNQTKGSFGAGGKGISISINAGGSTGGGGSGYFGGTTAKTYPTNRYVISGGAGGSSYVSGCIGCRSVAFDTGDIETTDKNVHYSQHFFTNIKMFSGIDIFLSPTGTQETGHSGNGAISITYIPSPICTCNNGYLHLVKSLLIAQMSSLESL